MSKINNIPKGIVEEDDDKFPGKYYWVLMSMLMLFVLLCTIGTFYYGIAAFGLMALSMILLFVFISYGKKFFYVEINKDHEETFLVFIAVFALCMLLFCYAGCMNNLFDNEIEIS